MAAELHRIWICCVLAAIAGAAPQSGPASRPGPDSLSAEREVRERMRAIEAKIKETAAGLAAGSLTSEAARRQLRAVFESEARPFAELSVSFSRACAVAAIRAEEELTSALADATKKIADAEDDLRARAEKLAASLWKLAPTTVSSTAGSSPATVSSPAGSSPAVPASGDAMARGLRAARDEWKSAASRALAGVAEIQTLREDAIAKHTQVKRRTFRVSQDVKNQFAQTMQQLLAAAPELHADIEALLADVEARGEQLLERARLAQERALNDLDGAARAREQALAQAQQKFERELQSFETARTGSAGEWDRNLRRFSTEAAQTLRDLAERNRASFESRANAVRTLWQVSEPVERARRLDPATRDKMLLDRQGEYEELRRTAAEIARLRELLSGLRARAAMD